MKIAIIGTRGIPNRYGGFEQFAEYLSVGLVEHGFEVYVYNPHNHDHQDGSFNGVNIIYKKDPESVIGTVGQFFYDLNCILDCRKRNFDIIFQLGYTSSSVWNWLFPDGPIIVTNMDGLEWKRSKYSRNVQKFLLWAESLAVKSSDFLISDSIGIQQYISKKYGKHSEYIPYGANPFSNPDTEIIKDILNGIPLYGYNMLLARMEPENNIEAIIKGHIMAENNIPLLVIGNIGNNYGKELSARFNTSKIRFMNPIYDMRILNNLRYYSNLYFHGHSVGGTNPSLLEAMASSALICAHNNIFNESILGKDAFYFSDAADVAKLVDVENKITEGNSSRIAGNLNKINKQFSWPEIISRHKDLFERLFKENNSCK